MTTSDTPPLPERYREPLYKVFDNVMPDAWVTDLGRWLYTQRAQFVRGGDVEGVHQFNYELLDLDRHCDLLGPFKKRFVELYPEALDACGVEDFDLHHIECHATLYHHGGHCYWHDDVSDPPRSLAFDYYLHTTPVMFSGGELEFLNGLTVEPMNNRLCVFAPTQRHRVTKAECWSAHVLHGRWALTGGIYSDQPPCEIET